MCAKALAFCLGLALPLLLVRRLSVQEFGWYKQAFLLITTAVNVLPLGFGMSAYYFLPREPARQRQIVLNILLFSMFAGGLGCLLLNLFPSLLVLVFKETSLRAYAPLIGLVIPLWILGSFLEILAVAHQDMKLATLFIVGGQVTRIVLMLGAAEIMGTVKALIGAAVVHGILQACALILYLNFRFPGFYRKFDASTLRSQLSYALPLGFAGLLYVVQTDLHNYFVSNRLGAVSYAVYAIGCLQLPLVPILSEAVGSVLIPRVSYLQKMNDSREIISLTARAARKLSAVFFPLCALLMVVAHEFIIFLFTRRYEESCPIFMINLTLLPLSILPLDPIVRAYADYRFTLIKIRLVMSIVLFGALWLGVLRFGPIGAIVAVVIVSLVERLIVAIVFGRVLGVSKRDAPLFVDIGKLAMAAAAAGVLTELVRLLILSSPPFVVLLVCGGVFSLVYGAAVLLLGVLTRGERDLARRWLSAAAGLRSGSSI